ncbi:DUF2254 domain-containing protein [Pseudopontixanthobacter vadosimaris]|uniref:DUF2254 domain-containing protein n=1 Tax=Pseudopontixanthobacter vadosimaris TaxID=2726450 RepID=UPI0014745DEB|nr:DUF2254 domain-containing protein [Pseudopontixanthobacter vadosimaris]
MITRLKAFWQSVNASYWFFPALFALSALVLALVTTWLDKNGYAETIQKLPWLDAARPQSATDMLTVISSSMIGVASTVFSITIAAVAYASGTYGPRLLTNFMEDRGNQLSLATFIGTFVYSVTILRNVRAEGESPLFAAQQDALPGFVPQLSLLVAYVFMAVAIMVLVFFLNHVPASIRINSVLEGIGSRLLKEIETRYDKPNRGAVELEQSDGRPIHARQTGYIQIVDYERLRKLVEREKGRLALEVRPGDFVHPGMVMAFWRELDDLHEPLDLPDDDVRDCFAFGAMRTTSQDLQFLIDELVEIGLRALSPGVNDPFTAVTSIHWLGAAVAELVPRDLAVRYGEDEDPNNDLLIPLRDDFDHFIERSFGAMRGAVATSRIASLVTFDALINASLMLDDAHRRRVITRAGDRLIEQIRENITGPDLVDLEARYVIFTQKLAR